MKRSRIVFPIILVIAIIMVYAATIGISIPFGIYDFRVPSAKDMRFGIDIRGGVDATYEPVKLDRKPTEAELEAARAIIETRLDQQNILDREVTIDKVNGNIIVRFPWKSTEKEFNPEKALAELGQTAMLTFRDDQNNEKLQGKYVKTTHPQADTEKGGYAVALEFTDEGAQLFSQVTGELVNKTLNIYMDETLIQSATVETQINGGRGVITGIRSMEEAKSLSDKINSGALPFSMETKNHSITSPQLGEDALSIMVQAGLIAFLIICLLLLMYYKLPGFVACISLMIQVSGTILVLSIMQITVTITGIAGIILSIGMGVDANVIISERISDEIKSGKTTNVAIKSGFKGAFSSVFDGNITVLIVAFVLMIFGSGPLLSFAYTLVIGIAFNFLAGVTASRLMIGSLSSYRFLQRPKLYTCLSRRVSL